VEHSSGRMVLGQSDELTDRSGNGTPFSTHLSPLSAALVLRFAGRAPGIFGKVPVTGKKRPGVSVLLTKTDSTKLTKSGLTTC
jgi:hypothetical protein